MTRFRWITLCRALDVLEVGCTNAQFHRLFEEYGLGNDFDAEGGSGLTTPKLHSLLLRLLRRDPSRRDTEGNLVTDELVKDAARHLQEVRSVPSLFGTESHRTSEKEELTALRNSLAVDGWSVEKKVLVPIAPIALEQPRTRLRENLQGAYFGDAAKRFDQLEATLDAGSWEAANSVTRGFLASLFVAICQTIESGALLREESEARKHLATIGFFTGTRQSTKHSPEAEFIWKMSGMMGTEGVHAGESTQETATYRYALALLTADYFIQRLKRGHH